MANYHSILVIQPNIPTGDVSLLEYLLLRQMLTVNTEGDSHFLSAERGSNLMINIRPTDLREAFRDSVRFTSQVAPIISGWLDSCDMANDDEARDMDLTALFPDETYVLILQDIDRRSQTLTYLTISGAHTCTRMRPDGFGGFAAMITANEIRWMSTDSWIESMFDELKIDA